MLMIYAWLVSINEDLWLVDDNKLSIHFGDDKTKSIIFATKFKVKKVKILNMRFGDIKTKQDSNVKHLGYTLDKTMSGEAIILSVINKINSKQLTFLHLKNAFDSIY